MVEGDDFFFLELNGRIQVEHPVTEAVTGLDLVAEQLRIADGEPLSGEPPTVSGHAVEVRLYAEHPRSFLPQTGRLDTLELPRNASVRIDAGVEEGDEVGLAYDPMIAKVVAHAPTREEALDALAEALAEIRVAGVTTNLTFLRWLVSHPSVRAGETTTAFLTEHAPLSALPSLQAPATALTPWRLNLPPPRLRHRRPTSTTRRIARRQPKARARSPHRCRGRSSDSRSLRVTRSAPASRSSSSRP